VAKTLVIASIAWPLLLGGAVAARAHQSSSSWITVVYAACSRVCHQRPLRSFHTDGVQWPVCARCSGLYLAAGAGTVTALFRRRTRAVSGRWLVALAAVPTLLTLGLEWTALASITNAWRFAAALPLGAAIGWVLVDVSKARPYTSYMCER
jgi:uncharacterized membrane protein